MFIVFQASWPSHYGFEFFVHAELINVKHSVEILVEVMEQSRKTNPLWTNPIDAFDYTGPTCDKISVLIT